MKADDPIHVLFVHGLESGPEGTKVQIMRRQGFKVSAAHMHMSLMKVTRRNSAVRQIPRLIEPRIVAAAVTAGLAVAGRRNAFWSIPAAVGGVVLWGAVRKKAVMSAALARSLEACVKIQREAVEQYRPDVIVGSSWGGAVTAELLLRGYWRGPTVLLAPAIHKVADYTGAEVTPKIRGLQAIASSTPMVVYHDPTDDTVPFEDSVDLVGRSEIEFHSVDAGGHRLLGLLERGELAHRLRGFA